MKTDKSADLFEKSVKFMPGGVNSPVRAFRNVGRCPVFIDKAIGSHIYDVDGNEYIDYVCSWGPNILGSAKAEVVDAVKKACEIGLTYGAPTEREYELATLISDAMPSIEMLRLVNSGTEAVMSAIRAARGFTGRDYIVKFKGCYHGHSDGLLVKAGSAALTEGVPDSAGVPCGYTKTTLVAEYNNITSVEEIFNKYGDNIACIIVEPVAANMGVVPPKSGFLQALRDITTKYGALLIFDEVITGFRLSYGGAQELYGITPDITTLGKIVGGGMPLAAYGGRREIMEVIAPVGSVYQAGTLSGNPIATAAGVATLKLLKKGRNEIYRAIDSKAAKLENIFASIGITVNRVGSLLSAFFTNTDVCDYDSVMTSDTKRYADYFSYMLENGVYIAPSQYEAMFVSYAHSDEDINRTCELISKFKLN
jgi:glutamate-1-semialdehyde 2,1-aminomutase